MTGKRYAVECDSPDGGRTTYPECWGSTATSRGRVLSEHDDLMDAVAACGGCPAGTRNEGTPWVFDRQTKKIVGERRLNSLYRKSLPAECR